MNQLTEEIIRIIQAIPEGRVMTYGSVAAFAGNSRVARQVARILNTCSDKYQLPWHRVISSKGRISLPENRGRELQAALLENEGVEVGPNGSINLKQYHVHFAGTNPFELTE